MHRTHRRATRPAVGAVAIALAVAIGPSPATGQSPSAGPGVTAAPDASMGPVASGAPVPSAAAIDVATLTWRMAKPAKAFHPSLGPIAFDLAVGADGRTLLAGMLQPGGGPPKAVVWGSDGGRGWKALKGKVPDGSQASAVLALDDGFLVVGSDGRGGPFLRRSDGTRLSRLDSPAEALPDGALYDVTRSATAIHAAGIGPDGASAMVWTSLDGGSTWSGSSLDGGSRALDVAVTDTGTIAALGAAPTDDGLELPTVWSSTDGGTTWAATTLPVEAGRWSLPDLERTPVGLVAIIVGGTDADRQATAWLSQDGVAWQQVLELPSSASAGTAGGEAIVLGSDVWWHSPDGVAWTEMAAPEFEGYAPSTSAVLSDGRVIAAGSRFESLGSTLATWVGEPATQ